jgi:hypothetical protein
MADGTITIDGADLMGAFPAGTFDPGVRVFTDWTSTPIPPNTSTTGVGINGYSNSEQDGSFSVTLPGVAPLFTPDSPRTLRLVGFTPPVSARLAVAELDT